MVIVMVMDWKLVFRLNEYGDHFDECYCDEDRNATCCYFHVVSVISGNEKQSLKRYIFVFFFFLNQ